MSQSSTLTPTSTRAGAAATSTGSGNPPLPNRTIIALGLGFIGAALGVVAISVLIRANEVRRATQAARREGHNASFGQMWHASGGWWGTLFNEQAHWRRIRVRKEKSPPLFWEVVMDRRALDPKDEFSDDSQPLAAVASRATENDPDDIVISALIILPSHPVEEEIPDLMIGTTHLRPTIPLAEAGLDDKTDDDASEDYEIRDIGRPPARPHYTMAWGLDARIP